jgi:ligand-binding sensor domain-containing protein/signal transduction histidine kinase/CheY-like chemotaxis protein/AraC-like DNA-binding protein
MTRALCILFVLVTCVHSLAQKKNYNFYSISVDQGLPTNDIQNIFHDSFGFLWIATYEGVVRYDGYSFKKYRHNEKDTSSINHNIVYTIFEDSDARLWVGTIEGLNLYNREKDSFVRSQIGQPDQKIPVNAIREDAHHNLWLGTSIGLCNYLHGSKTSKWYYDNDNNLIFCLSIDRFDNIWMGTFNGGVKKFSQDTRLFTRHLKIDSGEKTIHSNNIKSLLCDDRDQVWVGTDNGIAVLDLHGTLKNKSFDIQNKASQNTVNFLFQDRNKTIWVGIGRNSLYYIDNGQIGKIREKALNSSRYPLSSVTSICEDTFGNTWFGTAGNGLFHTNKYKNAFENHLQDVDPVTSARTSVITTIHQDSDKTIWIGTESGGFIRRDANDQHLSFFTAAKHGLTNDAITDIKSDNQGHLWLTTWSGGVMRFDPKTEKIKTFTHHPSDPNSLLLNDSKAILVDDTLVWIGTHGEGLVVYDQKRNRFIHRLNNHVFKFQMDQPGWINHLFKDSQNRLWISSYSGLFLLRNGRLDRYTHSTDSTTISSNSVNMVEEDLKGRIWVISDAGLDRWDERTKSFIRYRDKHALPETMKSIITARSGLLWIGTNEGIVSFDADTGNVSRYDQYDGLQGNTFFHKAILEDDRGRLYFGGPRGLNIFHPDSLKPAQIHSQFHTTDLYVYNTLQHPERKNSPLTSVLDFTDELVLTHNQSFFSIDLAAINLYAPGRTQYAYMLEGLQNEWINLGTERKISFTDLPPADYKLKIRFTEPDGQWVDVAKELRITVLPPWYQTSWFKFLVLVLVSASIAFIFYLRFSAIKRRNRFLKSEVDKRTRELLVANEFLIERSEEIRSQNDRLEEFNREVIRQSEKILDQQKHITDQNHELERTVVELQKLNKTKDHFFSILAHDLKNPVSALTGISDFMKNNFGKLEKKEALKYLTSIHTSSNAIYDLLVNLLNWSRTQSKHIEYSPVDIHVSGVIRKNIALLESQFTNKHIRIIDETPADATLFADYNMIDTVIRNIFSNSIKFTEYNGEIRAAGRYDGDQFEIAISDNGVGMNDDQIQKLFSLDKNNISTGTAGEKGTGLGLVICAEFIAINKGTIRVESTPGKGTTFFVSLPKSQLTISGNIAITEQQEKIFGREKDFWEAFPVDKLFKIKGKKVLIVDDNAELRSYLRLLLSGTFEIFEASDGIEGLRTALDVQPSTIVTDLIMPKMNGLEFCKQVKSNPATSHIPVVLLTSQWEENIQLSGYEAGADIYLTKPVKKELFIQVILNFISNQEKLRDRILHNLSMNTPIEFGDSALTKLDEEFLGSLIHIIELNIADANLDSRIICEELGISRSVLYAKIKTLTGQTVHEFIKAIRLKHAVILLREGKLPISQVASEVGFSSHSYFDKCFTKQYGTGPKEYLKKNNLRIG